MKVRVHVYSGNYDNRVYDYDNVDHWEITEEQDLDILGKSQGEGFATFMTQIASFQRGTWNFIENLSFVETETTDE